MNENPMVCRMVDRETRSRRIALIARVTDDIPAGSYVALFDVRGELFLQVVENDDPQILSVAQVSKRIKSQ